MGVSSDGDKKLQKKGGLGTLVLHIIKQNASHDSMHTCKH